MNSQQQRRTYGKYLPTLLMLAEWMMVNILFAVTLYIFPKVSLDTEREIWLWSLLNIAFLPVAFRSGEERLVMRVIQVERLVRYALRTVGTHALFFLSAIALFHIPGLSTKMYLWFYLSLMSVTVVWSFIWSRCVKAYRRKGYNYKKVVIVGTGSTARRLYDQMISDPGFGYRVLGFFDKEWRPDFAGRYCGVIDDLDRFVKENSVDQIYYTKSGDSPILTQVVKIADDNVKDFYYVPQISHYISRQFQSETIGAVPVLSIRRNPLKKRVNRIAKRAFDLAFSSLFLLFYPLIFIPVALIIKLTSPGPIYFRQTRTGYRGKDFTCLKFRTMHVNVDADKAQATENDPRKTKFGDFLRRSSLDELPQFINVFKGDMSVVGPRPHMLKHTEDYTRMIDRYMVRHLVKPGITGWAQVNGFRGPTDQLWKMEKRVQYDTWYIENWSFLLDLKIIARTFLNVFMHDKNAF